MGMRRLWLGSFALLILVAIAVVGGLWRTGRSPAPAVSAGAEVDAPPEPRARGEAPALFPPTAVEVVHLTSAAAEDDADAKLGALAGRVVNAASGLPIVDAEVTLLKDGAVHSAQTGVDGRFLFRAPAAGRYELAAVTAEGFADFSPRLGQSPIIFEARPRLRVRDVVIYLSELVVVSGRVIDEAATPVAGAVITARRADLSAFDPVTAPSARSDAQGQFTLSVAGIVQLSARHPDYLGGSAWIDASAADADEVTITLLARAEQARHARISGTVVDPTREPVEAALVTAEPSAHRSAHGGGAGGGATLTDAAGRFTIPVLNAGGATYAVTASAKGFSEARAVEVAPDTNALTLELGAGVRLIGAVTEARSGRPVPAFSVVFSGSGRGAGRRTLSFLDANGQYEVTGLAPGRARVMIAAFGFAPSREAELTMPADGGPVRHDVALERGSRVRGLVVDGATQRPVSGARVTVEGQLAGEEVVVPVDSTAVTDARGEFALEGVAAGLRSIVVVAGNYHKRVISGIAAEPDGDVGPLRIELTATAAGEKPKTELTGIGAALGTTPHGFEVVNVVDGGGADRVGIVKGDLIVAIDGLAAAGMELADAVERIRGEEGAVIHLTVKRSDGSQVELAVVRRRVFY